MGTRCFIGIRTHPNVIIGIYNHFDGYLSGVGAMLLKHYDTEDKAWNLISYGNRSSLGDKPERGSELSSLDSTGNIEYGNGPYADNLDDEYSEKQRDYNDIIPRFEPNVKSIFYHQSDFEYAYVYDHANQKWMYATCSDYTLNELTLENTSENTDV